MSEPRFTPGPWASYHDSGGYHYIGAEHQGLAPTRKPGEVAYLDVCRVIRQAKGEANAQLISAAPELYNAVKIALEIVDLWLPKNVSEQHSEQYENEINALYLMRNKFLDALEKAEGKR